VGLSAIRAAAARHALVLDDLAIKVVLGLNNAAKEHPAVYAGVGEIMIFSGWVRWWCARLWCVHEVPLDTDENAVSSSGFSLLTMRERSLSCSSRSPAKLRPGRQGSVILA
jgi:hypothetical protein